MATIRTVHTTNRLGVSLLALLLLIGLPVGVGHAQPTSIADTTTLHDLRVDVGYLSADLLEGRETRTEGARLAARYITEQFQELGLSPGLDTAWTQPFDVTYSPNPHAPPGDTAPVVVERGDQVLKREVQF